MAEIKLTQAQQSVVDHQGSALLVAAAAGSGKTKVLVDRLLRKICDPIHPCNIQDFLIITYTKAAAAELQQKIAKEMSKKLANEPNNRHLQRQINHIYGAQISTIHAFCGNLLRTHGHILQIPSDFSVVEEVESTKLWKIAWRRVIENLYKSPLNPEMVALVDNLCFGRDDRGVEQVVTTLYKGAMCQPYPLGWIGKCHEMLDISCYSTADTSPWGGFLLEEFHRDMAVYSQKIQDALALMEEEPTVLKAYGPCFLDLAEKLKTMSALQDWQGISMEFPGSFVRLGSVRKFEDKDFLERLKDVKNQCVESWKSWGEIFYGDSGQVLGDLGISAQALRGGLELTKQLILEFQKEKRRRKLLDFGDLEHESVRLLVDEYTGKPTEIAREISQRYVEIMVDEYQDSNEIQDKIFRAIAKNGANRCMVGDVKQSIYRFRLADPTIFLGKYHCYHLSDQAENQQSRKILLSQNFRSRPEILSAVNHVFRAVMSPQVGDLDYTDQEALRPGLTFSEPLNGAVELHVMAPMTLYSGKKPSKIGTETTFVARKISNILQNDYTGEGEKRRRVEPQDIVILLRNMGSTAPAYVDALEKLGIPARSERSESVLHTREVETLVSLLKTIDNPRREVPLVATMASPLFGFDGERLAQLRAGNRQDGFYEILTKKLGECPDVAEFMAKIRGFRLDAQTLSLGELVQKIVVETKLEPIFGAMEQGRQRIANLRLFAEYAISFGKRSLYEFCNHLEQLAEQNKSLAVETGAGSGAVTVMSIHKSKGLEFPVVILADLSHGFNRQEMRDLAMTHPKLYASSSLLDVETHVRFPSMAKRAMMRMTDQENLSEELRILYVAMTRPQERLIMTYCSAYVATELKYVAQCVAMPTPSHSVGGVKNMGQWVLMGAMTRAEAGALFAVGGRPQAVRVYDDPWDIQFHTEMISGGKIETADQAEGVELPSPQALTAALTYVYPHQSATQLPTKLTPTQLKGRAVDDEVAEGAQTYETVQLRPLYRPTFATKQGLNPREIGTANHLFLQFANYSLCQTAQSLEGELTRLVAQNFLSPEQGQAVKLDKMSRLFQSEFGQTILCDPGVVREFKFSLLMSPQELGLAGEGEIMLQGVADCLLVRQDGLVIVDFKTDRVTPGSEAFRAKKYAPQLEAYGLALSKIYQLPVAEAWVYFLDTGVGVLMEDG